MKISTSITKRLKISLITVFLLLIIPTIAISSPIEDYIDFMPVGYEEISRIVTRNGTVVNTTIPENGEHLELIFKKDNELYEVHVVHFRNPFTLVNFWYSFVSDYSNGLDSAFSAVPFVYGEFNTEYMKMQLSAWYRGLNNTFFVVYGPRSLVVNDLKIKLNRW